ncbi:MAG TPA: hypothetical protein PKA78_12820 [Macellibacteroides fermentans]|uniref:hypothetical protein n=1 Tax=Macellibacteroides fermentans TaxID=879969 RepID=UPI002C720B53|nr:hypothetical protein [Macellibacteroides fermentans]
MAIKILENALLMTPTIFFVHQMDIRPEEEVEMRKHPLHIYFICRTPKIFLDNSLTVIKRDTIDFVFYSNVKGKRKDYPITTVNNPLNPIGSIDCDYPYSIIKFYAPDGNWVGEGKANLIYHSLCNQQNIIPQILNMEVLYIGQAFGTDGKRITIDRLKTHEKSIAIYDTTQRYFPDYEIWFTSMSVEPTIMSSFMFPPGSLSETDMDDFKKNGLKCVYPEDIPEEEQITAAEAALIRYFDTKEYNKQFLDFPKESKRFKKCYELDLNSIGIQFNTFDSIAMRFFSKSVSPSAIHAKTYFLHEGTERQDMFWMLNDKD